MPKNPRFGHRVAGWLCLACSLAWAETNQTLVHLRWVRGAVEWVAGYPVPGKPGRTPPQAQGEPAGIPSPLSMEWVAPDGAGSEFLPDPMRRRVEWEEGGLLRSQSLAVDSSDLFVKVPALARSLRLYRHVPEGGADIPLRAGKTLWAELAMPPEISEAPAAPSVGELIVVRETGPRSRRANVVILGDGYTASQKALFQQHLTTFANAVVSQDPPFMHYRDYFNIYGIFVPSNQSGADNPSQGITRDTYFDAGYNATITRLLTINTTKGFAVIREHVPEYDVTFCIVNSDVYGGSGGSIAVANYSTPAIVAHEVGHSFARLGDEYEYAGASPWEAPNTTRQSGRAQIRWNHWIAPATPVPTPETSAYASAIGLFEGAAYNATGWYRPKQNCRMRTNGVAFCSVCAEAYILTLYDKVSPVDSFSPPNAAPFASPSPVRLSLRAMRPSSHGLKVDWHVNGMTQPAASGEDFSQALPNGRHRIVARVLDTASVVRKDSLGLLRDSVAWTVDVNGALPLLGKAAGGAWKFNADARGLVFRLPRSGAWRLRLFGPRGEVLLERGGQGRPGVNALAWPNPLGPGLYVAEVEAAGSTARRTLVVPE